MKQETLIQSCVLFLLRFTAIESLQFCLRFCYEYYYDYCYHYYYDDYYSTITTITTDIRKAFRVVVDLLPVCGVATGSTPVTA